MKSLSIAFEVYRDNCPIDYQYLSHIKRSYTEKELLDWARGNVQSYAPVDASKNMITRSAKHLLTLLNL